MEPAVTGHQVVDEEELVVHDWRVARLTRAEAVRAEAEAKVANEQAAALARAVHEDMPHRQTDLREVAEKEAEAVPEWPPAS